MLRNVLTFYGQRDRWGCVHPLMSLAVERVKGVVVWVGSAFDQELTSLIIEDYNSLFKGAWYG
jgi:hypothetical protein